MDQQIKAIFEKAGFKCAKCGYYSPLGNGLGVNKAGNIVLCSICNTFAPEDAEQLKSYIDEKVAWQELETFRRFNSNKSSHLPHKRGMINKARQGNLMARPAFGYQVINGKLEPNEDSENVRLIFREFLDGKSLNQISRVYGISVNGIKKILHNFTYIGKIKFANQISQGSHQAIISPEIFNEVQKRFEFLSKKSSRDREQQF